MPKRRLDLPRQEVYFNGKVYYRYPTSSNKSDTRYFRNGGSYLHREIWKFHNGPIPPKYQVHHKDGDTANNELDNLILVKSSDHIRTYHKPTGDALNRLREHIDKIRVLTKPWHESRRGKDWHKRMARETWLRQLPTDHKCLFCGKIFQTKSRRENIKFCSNNCKSSYRRMSMVDNEQRTCIMCGLEFSANKYSKVMYCSRICADRHKKAPYSGA